MPVLKYVTLVPEKVKEVFLQLIRKKSVDKSYD